MSNYFEKLIKTQHEVTGNDKLKSVFPSILDKDTAEKNNNEAMAKYKEQYEEGELEELESKLVEK